MPAKKPNMRKGSGSSELVLEFLEAKERNRCKQTTWAMTKTFRVRFHGALVGQISMSPALRFSHFMIGMVWLQVGCLRHHRPLRCHWNNNIFYRRSYTAQMQPAKSATFLGRRWCHQICFVLCPKLFLQKWKVQQSTHRFQHSLSSCCKSTWASALGFICAAPHVFSPSPNPCWPIPGLPAEAHVFGEVQKFALKTCNPGYG